VEVTHFTELLQQKRPGALLNGGGQIGTGGGGGGGLCPKKEQDKDEWQRDVFSKKSVKELRREKPCRTAGSSAVAFSTVTEILR